MLHSDRLLTFRGREFRGSRYRCLLATHQTDAAVAAFLSGLMPDGMDTSKHHRWAPRGFSEPDEVKLAESDDFLDLATREKLRHWWLARTNGANTPNWDLVSEYDHHGKTGILLVEAKAHEAEFANDRCGATNPENLARIQSALKDATDGWNRLQDGFHLQAESKYQLSNRFAFAWKLATLGTPVVLVYLGFLDAKEMLPNRRLLTDAAAWRRCVVEGSGEHVPASVWGRTFEVDGTPLTVLIRSVRVDNQVTIERAPDD